MSCPVCDSRDVARNGVVQSNSFPDRQRFLCRRCRGTWIENDQHGLSKARIRSTASDLEKVVALAAIGIPLVQIADFLTTKSDTITRRLTRAAACRETWEAMTIRLRRSFGITSREIDRLKCLALEVNAGKRSFHGLARKTSPRLAEPAVSMIRDWRDPSRRQQFLDACAGAGHALAREEIERQDARVRRIEMGFWPAELCQFPRELSRYGTRVKSRAERVLDADLAISSWGEIFRADVDYRVVRPVKTLLAASNDQPSLCEAQKAFTDMEKRVFEAIGDPAGALLLAQLDMCRGKKESRLLETSVPIITLNHFIRDFSGEEWWDEGNQGPSGTLFVNALVALAKWLQQVRRTHIR